MSVPTKHPVLTAFRVFTILTPRSGDKLLPSDDQADHHVAEGAGDAHGQVAQGQGPEIHLGQPGEYIVEIDIFLRSLYN